MYAGKNTLPYIYLISLTSALSDCHTNILIDKLSHSFIPGLTDWLNGYLTVKTDRLLFASESLTDGLLEKLSMIERLTG